MAGPGRVPIVADINVLVRAVVNEPSADAQVLAILNEGLEFGLWLSPHILDGTALVLTRAFRFEAEEAARYQGFLRSIAQRTGGIVEPSQRVTDCVDWEDNRILELAEASGALLVVSADHHLLEMSPWRGTPIMEPDAFVGRVDAMRRHRRRDSAGE